MALAHVPQGHPEGPHVPPHHVQGSLDGDGVHLHEQAVHQVQIPQGCCPGLRLPPLQVVHDHLVALPGHDVSPHGDDAAAADGQQGQGDVVVAGPEGEVGPHAVGDPHGVGHVAAGLLDAADVGVLRQPLHGLRSDGAAGAAGDIVEDGGDGHRVGHGGEVAVHALLVGLVVVGGDEQQAVGPQLLGPQALLHHGLGAVGASAGDDRDTVRGRGHHAAEGVVVLLVGHGGALPGGAQGQNGVGAAGDVPLHQLPQLLEVHGAVGVEGGDQGHDGAPQMSDVHSMFLLKNSVDDVGSAGFSQKKKPAGAPADSGRGLPSPS